MSTTARPLPPEPAEHETDDVVEISSGLLWRQAVPSWLVSGIVHFLLLIVLALLTVAAPQVGEQLQISATPTQPDEKVIEFEEETPQLKLDDGDSSVVTTELSPSSFGHLSDLPTPSIMPSVDDDALTPDVSDIGLETAIADPTARIPGGGGPAGSAYDLRNPNNRRGLPRGATESSEAAVARALEWLANHQNADGSWNYDHRLGACAGRCGNAGTLADCRTGATAQALLPFLGAGQTHKQGKYKKHVEAGLYFLVQQMKVKNQMGLQCGDLSQGGGTMYSHGMAAIVLCEAYGMTHDRSLMNPAQLALNHIVYAQDPVGGGWRYQPRTAGDTSVVGWQLMALKSGHLAYLHVPQGTIAGASKFLDSVMSDYSFYGYTDPGRGQATTAIGILCRMYLGWKKDHPGIEKGIQYLARTGPSPGNMYYNYYATQCMRHYDGELWDQWNVKMRDQLVASQAKDGHMKGSWYMNGDHGSQRGGRLYCTSMATMTLEVYYRHLPIYGKQAADDDFPVK